MISHDDILQTLRRVRYPGSKSNIIDEGLLRDLHVDGFNISFSLAFTKTGTAFTGSVARAVKQALTEKFGSKIKLDLKLIPYSPPAKTAESAASNNLQNVQNIIAIASGKGGVGKSSVAANLAIALSQHNYRVGLLDADIYGPSLPKMFRSEDARPMAEKVDGHELIQPIDRYGVSHLSIGHFVAPADAIIWRGPMASNAVRQLIQNTAWGSLDVLLIDLPPGTGDVHLTIVQSLSLTGAIVVTTPQGIALADARKAISMFQNDKVNVRVLGIIENMSWFTPAELPDHKYYLFGQGGGSLLANETAIPLLAQIPIIQSICESSDAGIPEVMRLDSPLSPIFAALVQSLAQSLNLSLGK
ncbi:MAG: Mrp/NBP35 family ATP-binding protein [Tannerellaceae bacterium]|jgi:ATP-binding protein involved in chromosome partitioning|nr:Mrp/NBP35 family ATP-binding protein [Tannerellaceae bacterium]